MKRVVGWLSGVALGVALATTANAELPAAGTMIDKSNADEVKDLLPPEIYKHYASGEYKNKIADFPDTKFRWDEEFDKGTEWNKSHIVLDQFKSPVDKDTGKRPDYLIGLPFPDINESDADAGVKILWNLAYAYYAGGNSRNYTVLNWVSRKGIDRAAIQDVRFLYYEGQPKKYSPATNPDNLLYQLLALTVTPADLQGTTALSYRYKDPEKRDQSWAFVPALRRVRAVSPANRSDGFLGSDQSQDDGFFFDGKPEDFDWKVVGHREQLRVTDPDSLAGKVQRKALPDGGWRTVNINNERTAGFQVQGWDGVMWAPVYATLSKRKFWVLEGTPKDKYYLFGKVELWIDDHSWQGAWNRKFSWQGELLNTYQVIGFATADFNEHERWWGSTMGWQLSENIKADRATCSGQSADGDDPPNDRRVPLEPSYFDYQTLSRFGK